MVIADGEGKGISSAMVMSNLQAYAARHLVLHLHSLNDIGESGNQDDRLKKNTRGEKYMTM